MDTKGNSGGWIPGIEDAKIIEKFEWAEDKLLTSRVLWKRPQQEHPIYVSDENSRFSIPRWICDIGNKKMVDVHRDVRRFVVEKFSRTSSTVYSKIDGDDFESGPENSPMIPEEMSILIKFKSKSERVNGISLHSRWPWILTALDNGTIQLWDYEKGRLLKEFKGHEGAVRGICFNKNEPIFVSGADDAKVKVWSYETKECIFTLCGHRGCIRTTFFHDKYPWIISASDDTTARLWNFRTRRCFFKFYHRTSVTCAQFYPSGPKPLQNSLSSSGDFVAIASLNEFIRVWDLTDLVTAQKRRVGTVKNVKELDFTSSRHGICTYGFQWVAFHPRLNHIISGSNNRRIDRSEFDRKKVRAIDSFRAHKCMVTSVLYHPTEQLIVSCSTDKCLRISDNYTSKFRLIYRNENDRFWALGAHPRRGILAAGHDNGMIVFKTRRERPVYCSSGDSVYYVNDGSLLEYNVEERKLITLCKLRSPLTFPQQYYCLSVNSDRNAFLLTTRSHNREICKLELCKLQHHGNPEVIIDYGTAAVWITNNRFVVLENSRISIRNLTNKVLYNFGNITVDDIFYSGRGTILLKKGSELQLFNMLQQIVEASNMIKERVRYVIWSNSMKNAALLSKDTIILVNRKLKILCVQKERAKSGAWDGDSVFVYNTKTHVKYLITSGDSGIIKSSDTLFYISKLKGDSNFPRMFYMYGEPLSNKVVDSRSVSLNASEYKAKLELINGNAPRAIEIISKSKCVGQSLIDFFGKCGYNRIPLELVTNHKTRFHMALENVDLLIASRAAFRINEVGFWKILGETALLRGDYQCAQLCYHVIGDYEKLLFLCFVGGNVENIVLGAARMTVHAQFQATLLIGDMKERINILRNCEQLGLAYLAAATHGYVDEARELKDELESRGAPIPAIDPDARLLIPPPPILRMDRKWPMLKLEPEVEINVKKEDEEEQCQMMERRTKNIIKKRKI